MELDYLSDFNPALFFPSVVKILLALKGRHGGLPGIWRALIQRDTPPVPPAERIAHIPLDASLPVENLFDDPAVARRSPLEDHRSSAPRKAPRVSRSHRHNPTRRLSSSDCPATRHGLVSWDDLAEPRRSSFDLLATAEAASLSDGATAASIHRPSSARGLMSGASLSTTDLRASYNAHYSRPQPPRGQM